MKFLYATKIIAAYALIYWPAASFSHIVLDNNSAVAGSTYKAAFQVGHGCSGSPTSAIAVQIPPGFQGAKPYAKPGWTIATEGNTGVTWTATSKEAGLQNAHVAEFTLRGKLTDNVGPLWFKVVQTCESGVNHWTEVPASGTSTQGLKSPATLLDVTAPGKALDAGAAEHKH